MRKISLRECRNYIKYKSSPVRSKWSYEEFLYYRMQDMTGPQQCGIMSVAELAEVEKSLNAEDGRKIFNSKKKFCQVFRSYMSRDILFLQDAAKEQFEQFLERHPKAVLKPDHMYAGFGVCVVEDMQENTPRLSAYEPLLVKDLTEEERKYRTSLPKRMGKEDAVKRFRWLASENYIAEEFVEQHSVYADVYSGCLNTVRVTTLLQKDGNPEVIAAANQFGSCGSVTDNDDLYGIWANICLATGRVDAAEIDAHTAQIHEYHPDSGKKLLGFKNPKFEGMKELALAAAREVPQCRMVGWDVCLRKDGTFELIEGNVTPELDLFQVMTGKGWRSTFAGIV